MLEIICAGNPSKDRINFNGRVSVQFGGPSYFITKALRFHTIRNGIMGRANNEFKRIMESELTDTEGLQESDPISEIEIEESAEKTVGRIITYAGEIDLERMPATYKDASLVIISTILD